MGKHAIIVIKNKNNEYLQYFDEVWNSYLFLNCKLDEFSNEHIIDFVSKELNIGKESIKCELVGDKVHRKFSESAKLEKEYHHYFYNVVIDSLDEKKVLINNKYSWFSYDDLMNDERIQKVNSDIVSFIKEFNL